MATLATSLVSQGAGIISGLLAAHALRLKDATNENEAVARVIPTFDADMHGAADAYNSGEASAEQVLDFLAQADGTIKEYLQRQVGKPGTAWTTDASGVCDKSCTVGCCIYNTFIHPAIVRLEQVIAQGSGKMTVPGIPTNKYNFPARAAYPLVIVKPAASLSGQAGGAIQGVTDAFSQLLGLGGGGGVSGGIVAQGPQGGAIVASGQARMSPLVLILAAILGVFLLVRLSR